jgi:peptidoglycan/LPS O-acetylase OafA/YrhL
MDSLIILAEGGLLMLAVIATAALIARYIPFYRREMAESGNREPALDGLRGMAALLVATYHAALCCTWLITGHWGEAGSPLLQLFGPSGVTVFFMLTGYLFWSKARAQNGKMNIWKLWRGRLYRIAPLYLFSLLLVLFVAVIQTGGHWVTLENWKPLARLLTLGALGWRSIGPVNLIDYNAGVVWTLRYEWEFYVILPGIAWLALGRKFFGGALVAYVLTFICLGLNFNVQPGLCFILGMLCPMLLENQPFRSQLRRPAAAAIALALTALLCALSQDYLSTKLASISLAGSIFPLFLAVAAGNSFFGFLTHPSVRCLGAISFSLYMLHGIMFRLVFRLLKSSGWTGWPQFNYWLILIATAIATTLFCAATYRWIEFPFLSRSHKNPRKDTAHRTGTPDPAPASLGKNSTTNIDL